MHYENRYHGFSYDSLHAKTSVALRNAKKKEEPKKVELMHYIWKQRSWLLFTKYGRDFCKLLFDRFSLKQKNL